MDIIRVFVVGGLICVIGQILLDTTNLTAPRILVLFVVIGGIMGAVGLYEPIAEFAKNGATVPITGFGYSLVKGAILEVQSSGLLGAFTGGLKQSAAGITAALTVGYIIALCCKPHSKK
jgi:stage V sporulation protein AE